MLKLLILLAALPSLLPAQQLDISHLTGDFYIYTTYRTIGENPFPSNSMYVVTSEGVVMFDTPWDTTQLEPLFEHIAATHGKPVVLCIATHFHNDRTAGINKIKARGIPTYASKMTYDLCRERSEEQPALFFAGDTTFTVGQYSFATYYPGPGHTVDNIVIWCNKEKILYGGCLVKSTENSGLGNVADANVGLWKYAIENVMAKYPNPEYVIPGHFGWESNQGLKHTLDLLTPSREPER